MKSHVELISSSVGVDGITWIVCVNPRHTRTVRVNVVCGRAMVGIANAPEALGQSWSWGRPSHAAAAQQWSMVGIANAPEAPGQSSSWGRPSHAAAAKPCGGPACSRHVAAADLFVDCATAAASFRVAGIDAGGVELGRGNPELHIILRTAFCRHFLCGSLYGEFTIVFPYRRYPCMTGVCARVSMECCHKKFK